MTNPFKKIKQWREAVINNIFDKEKVANRVPSENAYPGGTSGTLDAVKNYLFNDDSYVLSRMQKASQDADPYVYKQMLDHEDGKRLYLGLNQLYNSFEPSPYSPTIGTVTKPYQINSLLNDETFDNLILPMYGAWKTGKDWGVYGTKNRVSDLGRTAQLHDVPSLQNAGLSIGMDNRGQYLSLYDVWDYNSKIKNKNGDNIAKWVGGNPFNIYQRYYLDDWLDIPEDARGNPYIAPAYIEAKRNPDR